MNLYWFSDEDGHYWVVVAAKDDKSAWQRLAESQIPESGEPDDRMTLKEVRSEFVLNARTEIDGNTEGKVASTWPLECNFSINEKPGGELSLLSDY